MKRLGTQGAIRVAILVGLGAASLATCAAAGERTVRVIPPPRPALRSGADVDTTGSVVRMAAGEPLAITPKAATGGNDAAIVARANAALNSVTSMSAEFSQTGGEGRRLSGTVYVQRPGKLRFEYDKPSTLEVVSDGTTVLVRDRKLNTADPYPISQTPLKFLLSSRIDLGRDSTVRSVASDASGVRVAIEDTSTLGGTSRITLTFDPDITTLKQWRVTDPQGYTTTVALSGIEKNKTIDPKTFQLNYSRPVD